MNGGRKTNEGTSLLNGNAARIAYETSDLEKSR